MLAAIAPYAAGQISPVTQERSVTTSADVSSGPSSNDYDEASNFGPFVRSITSSITGAAGAGAEATASHNSTLTSTLLSGTLSAHAAARTGTTFDVGESDGQTSFLYIFSLAVATPIQFAASGHITTVGVNPNGDPSDLYGMSSVRLLDENTLDLISGFQLQSDAASDSATFNGTLPAGQYVILASAWLHAYSADLLGPPARSGSGDASATFTLTTVVPSPGAAGVLGIGAVAMSRRRRVIRIPGIVRA